MSEPRDDDPRFLTRQEAAARLRVGVALLDRLIGTGEIHAVRLRRRVVIPTSALRELRHNKPPT